MSNGHCGACGGTGQVFGDGNVVVGVCSGCGGTGAAVPECDESPDGEHCACWDDEQPCCYLCSVAGKTAVECEHVWEAQEDTRLGAYGRCTKCGDVDGPPEHYG